MDQCWDTPSSEWLFRQSCVHFYLSCQASSRRYSQHSHQYCYLKVDVYRVFALNTNCPVSFFLTPLNYFDYDVSIDSSNAILLHPPEEVGGIFTFDDYGVTPKNCIPNPVPEFEYSGMKTFGTDGNVRFVSVDEMRREAEVPFRIKVEL